MTQVPNQPQQPVVEVKPQPNVYTVLLIVAILVLGFAAFLVTRRLTSPVPDGYGMEFKELFDPLEKPEGT